MAADGPDPAWRLVAAAQPLIEHGMAEPLRELAERPDDPAARSAMRLLRDLGMEPQVKDSA
jgi:hypothetical protein